MRRTALHNAALSIGGQLGARGLALAVYATLARRLGEAHFGALGLGSAFGALFLVLVEPGLNPLMVRDGARSAAGLPARFASVLGYKLAMLFLAWPAMVGAAWLLGYRSDVLAAVALFGGTILLVGFEDLGSAALVAQERMDLESTLRLTSKLMFAGFGLTALFTRRSFGEVMAALLVGQLATTAAMLYLVRRSGLPLRVRLQLREAAALVRQALPLAVTGMIWLIVLRLDQIIASQLHVPESDVGAYNAAVKLVEALVLFPNALSVVFQPGIARAWMESPERCAEETSLAIEAGLAITMPIAVGGAILAVPLTTLVYGASFTQAGHLLAVQLGALPFIAVQFCAFSALIAAGSLRTQTVAVAVNLGVNLAVNFALVPRLGIVGASLAAVAGGAASSVVCLLALHQLGARISPLKISWRSGLASAGMALLTAAAFSRGGLVAGLAAGAATYAALFFLLGGRATVVALNQHRTPAVAGGLHGGAEG